MPTAPAPRPNDGSARADAAAAGAASTEVITSRRNPAVVEARKLDGRKHRRAQGRFLVEGLQLIRMALEAGHRPLDAFFAPAVLAGSSTPASALALPERLADAGARLHAVSADVLASLCERDDLQGVVATFATFGATIGAASGTALAEAIGAASGTTIGAAEPGDRSGGGAAFAEAIARRQSNGHVPRPGSPGLVLVLDRLQDPGNLGTLVRTADAVGADGVVLVEPCVDAFDPRAVRGSMGSLFTVPLAHASDVGALGAWLGANGYRVVGADAHGGAVWGDGVFGGEAGDGGGDTAGTAAAPGVALVLGNEARGLSADVDALIQARVRLPMVGRAESLNVAVAGGVLMYGWLRGVGVG